MEKEASATAWSGVDEDGMGGVDRGAIWIGLARSAEGCSGGVCEFGTQRTELVGRVDRLMNIY